MSSIDRNDNQILTVFERLSAAGLRRGLIFGAIIMIALVAFEIFNYSTTQYALADLLGSLTFAGIPWAVILAIAFCGIDFAGIARLFTPEKGDGELTEVWYLFGAWMLAATMNAILTWWGVSVAMLNHPMQSNTVLPPATILRVVPIFVAVMVWLIRILIIGSFSMAGERLFSQGDTPYAGHTRTSRRLSGQTGSLYQPNNNTLGPMPLYRPAPQPAHKPEPIFSRPEPTYQSVHHSARPRENDGQKRQL